MTANPVAGGTHTPVRTAPLPGLPPRFDGRESELLNGALRRNNLFYNQPDGLTARFTKRAAEALGAPFDVATSSATAALHAAVIAAVSSRCALSRDCGELDALDDTAKGRGATEQAADCQRRTTDLYRSGLESAAHNLSVDRKRHA